MTFTSDYLQTWLYVIGILKGYFVSYFLVLEIEDLFLILDLALCILFREFLASKKDCMSVMAFL